MRYRREEGCLKQYLSGFLCTFATHSQSSCSAGDRVCQCGGTGPKKQGVRVDFRAVGRKIEVGVGVKLKVV